MTNNKLKVYDVYTCKDMQNIIGKNTKNKTDIVCIKDEVPIELHPIIKYVKRYGIACDPTRHSVFSAAGEKEISKFYTIVSKYESQITGWLDELPKNPESWSKSAVSFLYVLKALSEAYTPSPEEVQKLVKSRNVTKHNEELRERIRNGMKAYRRGDHSTCYKLLSQYEGELEGEILNKFNNSKNLVGSQIGLTNR